MDDYQAIAKEYVEKFKNTPPDSEEREDLLVQLTDEDLCVLEELLTLAAKQD